MTQDIFRQLLLTELDRSAELRARVVEDADFSERRAPAARLAGGAARAHASGSPREPPLPRRGGILPHRPLWAERLQPAHRRGAADRAADDERPAGFGPGDGRPRHGAQRRVGEPGRRDGRSARRKDGGHHDRGVRARPIGRSTASQDRERQIDLIALLGEALDKLTHLRFIGMTLKVMRKPARLAGLGELQAFLERGYSAFGAMRGGAGEFVSIVVDARTGDLPGAPGGRRRGAPTRRRLSPARRGVTLSVPDGASTMPAPGPERFNLAWHCLGRQAAERGGKTALIIADGSEALRSWTYAELDRMVRRLAGGLIQSGLGKGDRVMIRAANDVDFRSRLFRRHGDRLRRPAGFVDADRRRGAGAGGGLRRRGDLSRRRRFERAGALFPSAGLRPAGDAPARRRGRAGGLRRDLGGRPRLSRLHLRLDRRTEGRAARPPGRDRPPADGGRLAGPARGRRHPPRRQHQLDLYARRRRARSFRARGDRRALRRPARRCDLACPHRADARHDLRRRAERLPADR